MTWCQGTLQIPEFLKGYMAITIPIKAIEMLLDPGES